MTKNVKHPGLPVWYRKTGYKSFVAFYTSNCQECNCECEDINSVKFLDIMFEEDLESLGLVKWNKAPCMIGVFMIGVFNGCGKKKKFICTDCRQKHK